MKPGFAGFRPEAMKFLRGLKKNNDREWFQPRKETFDNEVKAPMIELVAALQREIETAAPDYLQDPAKCVYRIYRDTRFSKDKTPYKTHISAALKKQGLGRDGSAVFYFHLAADEVVIAVGSYMPGPVELRALRNHMAENYKQFAKLCQEPKLRASLGALQGAQLNTRAEGLRSRASGSGFVEAQTVLLQQRTKCGNGHYAGTLQRAFERLKGCGTGHAISKSASGWIGEGGRQPLPARFARIKALGNGEAVVRPPHGPLGK